MEATYADVQNSIREFVPIIRWAGHVLGRILEQCFGYWSRGRIRHIGATLLETTEEVLPTIHPKASRRCQVTNACAVVRIAFGDCTLFFLPIYPSGSERLGIGMRSAGDILVTRSR